MPKAVEECVSKIHGTNKRTGKPYTESEKWAICTAMHKKKMGKSESEEFELEELQFAIDRVEKITELCLRKLISSGRAKDSESAYKLYDAALSRVGYDIDSLEFIFNKIL